MEVASWGSQMSENLGLDTQFHLLNKTGYITLHCRLVLATLSRITTAVLWRLPYHEIEGAQPLIYTGYLPTDCNCKDCWGRYMDYDANKIKGAVQKQAPPVDYNPQGIAAPKMRFDSTGHQ